MGKIESAQKVVVYGPEGIGKSTFASHFPHPIFIDTEGSTKHLDVARTPRPSSWTLLIEQIRYLKSNSQALDTLVIDTADWAEILCIEYICANKLPPKGKENIIGIEDFGYGKGYTYLAEEFGRLLNLLEELIELGINVVINAHAQMRKFEQPDELGSYDRWEMKLQKKTAPLLKEWADMVLFANYKTYVVNVDNQGVQKGKNKAQGGNRVMYTTHHPCWDAKNRDNLKEQLEFKYQEIAHCIPTLNQTEKSVVEPVVQVAETINTQTEIITNKDNKIDGFTEVVEADSDFVPKPLADLMENGKVTLAEIQKAVELRGYYPPNTPFKNYDPDFISGVLVGAWAQVFKIILDIRNEEEK
ncbi:ATP-binding protein [Alkalibaculum sporogenes]